MVDPPAGSPNLAIGLPASAPVEEDTQVSLKSEWEELFGQPLAGPDSESESGEQAPPRAPIGKML